MPGAAVVHVGDHRGAIHVVAVLRTARAVVVGVGQRIQVGDDRGGDVGEGLSAGIGVECMQHAVVGADVDLRAAAGAGCAAGLGGGAHSVVALEGGVVAGATIGGAVQCLCGRGQVLRTTHQNRPGVDDVADQRGACAIAAGVARIALEEVDLVGVQVGLQVDPGECPVGQVRVGEILQGCGPGVGHLDGPAAPGWQVGAGLPVGHGSGIGAGGLGGLDQVASPIGHVQVGGVGVVAIGGAEHRQYRRPGDRVVALENLVEGLGQLVLQGGGVGHQEVVVRGAGDLRVPLSGDRRGRTGAVETTPLGGVPQWVLQVGHQRGTGGDESAGRACGRDLRAT
ncbi:MAG: hypothetical protein GAK45_00405 [Pseudomonas citronellolis]|nr:MAG: hypothetical protein GAK45_00405 [Pseudomonas citronellolis]